jgi:hypothetical protein
MPKRKMILCAGKNYDMKTGKIVLCLQIGLYSKESNMEKQKNKDLQKKKRTDKIVTVKRKGILLE